MKKFTGSRSRQRKRPFYKKLIIAVLLSAALCLQESELFFSSACAAELQNEDHEDKEQTPINPEPEIPIDATDAQETPISLAYISNVTIDTAGSIVRLYGSEDQTYQVPIQVLADCTIILDHVKNEEHLKIANGTNVTLRIRGSNSLKNIDAVGGSATMLSMIGDSADAMLTADNIACPAGGTTTAGAEILIKDCSLACKSLGCGADGIDKRYHSGNGVYVASATPGSSASPKVTIQSSNVFVTGNVCVGGNGVQSEGTAGIESSAGGKAGEVLIISSQVTVGGNMAIGGKGGEGRINETYNSLAGTTQSSCPVTIKEQSRVTVTGNVATQQALPQKSDEGTQRGLHGVQVTVLDSELTAKDIASGGAGHDLVKSYVLSNVGHTFNIKGTAGGNGGKILAENAVITCETAVNGANSGQYQNYTLTAYGNYGGDYTCVNHPADGNGGTIISKNSEWNIKQKVGEKGSRWNNYPNPSVYSDQSFTGGTISGTVCGAVITVDLTGILSGGFQAATDIRNSEEASCAKCVLKTSEELAGETVQIKANELNAATTLNENGELHTYLGIGKQTVRLAGSSIYAGNLRVKRSEALNEFQLDAYGKLQMEYSDATIRSDSYTYLEEDFTYSGTYSISGTGADKKLIIESGRQFLIFGETEIDQMIVKGTSVVTIRLDDAVTIKKILVEENATLIIQGTGSLNAGLLGNENGKSGTIRIEAGIVRTDKLGSSEGGTDIFIQNPTDLTVGECAGTLRGPDGRQLFSVLFILDTPDDYTLILNEEQQTLTPDIEKVQMLLYEGDYSLALEKAPFLFRDRLRVAQPQTVFQSDLLLYLDSSLAPIEIGEQVVSSGAVQLASSADVCLTQSTATPQAITVTRLDAMLWLDSVTPDIQIYLPEEFSGAVRDKSGKPLRLITIQTDLPNQDVLLHLDESEYQITTNDRGVFTFLAMIGRHDFHFTIGETTYYPKQPSFIISSTDDNLFTMDDLSDQEPKEEPEEEDKANGKEDEEGDLVEKPDGDKDTDSEEKPEEGNEDNAGSGTDDDNTGKGDGGTGENGSESDGNGSGNSSSDNTISPPSGGTSGGTSSGGNSGFGYGGVGSSSSSGGSSGNSFSGSTGSSSGGNHINSNGNSGSANGSDNQTATGSAVSDTSEKPDQKGEQTDDKADQTTTDGSGAQTEDKNHTADLPTFNIKASLTGIRFLSPTNKNKFTYYTNKTITFTLQREKNTTYSYKVIPKGKKASSFKWKTLKTKKLTIKANKKTTNGAYILFRAVNAAGKTKLKTNGFVIDQTAPKITGAKHLRCYNKKRRITVSDNSGDCQVLLNGKKIKQSLTVKKRGVYILKATDAAGNKKRIIFAIW